MSGNRHCAIASILFCLNLLLSSCAAGEVRPLIPRSVLFSQASVAHVRLSPDGSQYSYIKIEGSKLSAWVAPVDASADQQRVGDAVPGKTHDCWWSADGNRLILWQEVSPGVAHLVRLDIDSGKHLDLTPIPNSVCRFAGLSAAVPKEILFTTNGRDPAVNELWRVNLDTGERSLVQDTTGLLSVHVDEQLVPRVAERLRGSKGAYQVELLALDPGGKRRTVGELSYDDLGFYEQSRPVIGVNAAGSRCYVVDRSDRDKSCLYELDVMSGGKKLLAEDPNADIALNTSSETFSISNSYTKQLMAVSAFFDCERQYALSPEVQANLAFLSEYFGAPAGVSSTSADGKAWIVFPLDGGPKRYYHFHSAGKQITPLLPQHAELGKHQLAKRSLHVAPTRDGLRLPCHLYLPPGADRDNDGYPDSPMPMMMWVHGGPNVFYSWDDWLTNRHLQLLADRGYASLRVEFRGADGLGRKVRRMGYGQWGAKAQDDIDDIAKWAVDQGIANSDKMGIWGWSYGGYTTNAAATIAPSDFKCGISMYGVSSLESLLKQSGRQEDTNWWRKVLADERTQEGREDLTRRSPAAHVEKAQMPLLITCGGRDALVPHNVQSEPFARRLHELGKPVTYLYYPDEPHDYRRDENWISFWAIGERFLAKHLGGRFEPYQNDLMSGTLEVKLGADKIPGLVEASKKDFPRQSPG